MQGPLSSPLSGEQDIGAVAGAEDDGKDQADLDDALEDFPDDRQQDHCKNDGANGEYIGVSRRLAVVLIVHGLSVTPVS